MNRPDDWLLRVIKESDEQLKALPEWKRPAQQPSGCDDSYPSVPYPPVYTGGLFDQ